MPLLKGFIILLGKPSESVWPGPNGLKTGAHAGFHASMKT